MTKLKSRNYIAIAARYAGDVVSGKILACQWTIKACQRQINDLEKAKSKEFPYKFNEDKAARICRFIEMLPHIKGEWTKHASRIELQPWQIFILTAVFGWIRRDTGTRRIQTVLLEMPRKQGKSSISSGVALYCRCLDGESGGEIYSAATTRDQAKIVWQDAWHMVERSPGLKKTFGVSTTAHAISQIATASRFQALSAEGNSLDGLNIHCAIVDELHAHRTRKVYDVLETATGARTQPLIWSITTAGSDRSGICYEQRTYLTKVLDEVVKDDTYFGVIYTMDEGCDWTDPASWRMANPNFGVSVFPDDLERLCLKAQKMPSAQNNFLTKRLSVWVNADVTLFDLAKWQSLGDLKLRHEDFIIDPCWIRLDFAPRHDFTSRVLLFRRGNDYYVFAKHFLSEGEIEESDNAHYAGWAREGWIHTNEGNQTDDRDLDDDVVGIIEAGYQVQEIDCDPSRLQGVQTRISERTGATVVDILQNVRNLSAPTKKLDALIADGKIHNNGDPVFTWMLSNVVGHYDRKENVYPVKERPENKIDGAIALIIALARAMVGTGPAKNIYETRGPVFV
jgi:phage terminase large subunit-like protein